MSSTSNPPSSPQDTPIKDILRHLCWDYGTECGDIECALNNNHETCKELDIETATQAISQLITRSNEIFVPVRGAEGSYEVSNTGKVRSVKGGKRSGKELKPRSYNSTTNRGYPAVTLVKNGKSVNATIHRLVASAFLSNPENKPQVNHKDGDKFNNHVDNLEWSTASENIQHAYDELGKVSTLAKLTVEEAQEVKRRSKTGERIADIAKEFGISDAHVYQIRNGYARPNLKESN